MCMMNNIAVLAVILSVVVLRSVLSEKSPLCNGQNCDTLFKNYLVDQSSWPKVESRKLIQLF